MRHLFKILLFILVISGCKNEKTDPALSITLKEIPVTHAKGFKIFHAEAYKKIEVTSPWPGSKEIFTYLLIESGSKKPENINYDAIIEIPVQKLVVTSTSHIPALELLGIENTLVGFPGSEYISSEKTRKNIDSGKVK